MKRLLLVSLFVLVTILLASAVATATPPEYFYLEKVCDGTVGDNACYLQNSEPANHFAILDGGRIVYYDKAYFENPAGVVIESAEIVLEATDGSTLGGHIRWVKDHGYFTLRQGALNLKGVHAKGVIEVVDWETMTFSFTGTYHIEP